MCFYRREIQVWLYSKYGLRVFNKSQYAVEVERLFDGFVSYCKKDENFIASVLAPELECGHPPYRLCLRYRDLPVTGYVVEAITEAIESSHRTIILLSEQYLKSDSSRFELKVAHHESSINHNHQLIIVVLDKRCLNQLDAEAKMLLRPFTVIHWGDKRFWEKLRYSLPPPRGHQHHLHLQNSQLQQTHNYHHHHNLNSPNCPDVRASLEFKRPVNISV